MKWIWLRSDYFVCVDAEDYENVKYMTFRLDKGGYALCYYKGIHTSLHCFLLKRHNKNDGFEIDHINRAKWDNRRCNLRIVSRHENQLNKGYPYNAPFPSDLEKKEAIEFKLNELKEYLKIKNKKQACGNKYSVKSVINSNGEIFESASEASKILKINQSHITACCKGTRLTAGKLKWNYN